MKKALISPGEEVRKIVAWEQDQESWIPNLEVIPNGARIAEVADVAFEVAPPLFWVDCDDTVPERNCYYDTVQQLVLDVAHAPHPAPPPTRSSGDIPAVTL